MEKEIHEQPIALERAINSYLSDSTGKPTFNLLKKKLQGSIKDNFGSLRNCILRLLRCKILD